MNLKHFISEALSNPTDYISYFVSRRLAELYPDKEIVEGESYSFDLDEDEAIPQVALQTAGFSFAYLKELFLSSMMQWIAAPGDNLMDAVMLERAGVLREQMSSMTEEPAPEAASDDED